MLEAIDEIAASAGAVVLGLFILSIVVGVPTLLLFIAFTNPSQHRVKRWNQRLFHASLALFYVAFGLLVIHELIKLLRI